MSKISKCNSKNQLAILEQISMSSSNFEKQRQKSYKRINIINQIARLEYDGSDNEPEPQQIQKCPNLMKQSTKNSENQSEVSKCNSTVALNPEERQQSEQELEYCFKCDNLSNSHHKCLKTLQTMPQILQSLNGIKYMAQQYGAINFYGFIQSLIDINDFSKLKNFVTFLKDQSKYAQCQIEAIIYQRMINVGGKKIALLI